MKLWQAMYKGRSLITVLAADEAAAKREVERQLDRDGRRDGLLNWRRDGCQVQPVEALWTTSPQI